MTWAEFHGKIATKVDDGSLARGVAVRALLADGANSEAGDGGGDEHAAGVFEGIGLLQERRKEADGVEDGLDVQIHDLCKRRISMGIETLSPRRARIRKQDIYMIRMLLDLLQQALHALFCGRIRGGGDGSGAGLEVGKGI